MSFTNALGIILGGGRGERLFPLTKYRAEPAVPLAGKYRIVDIPLSNCINSGIRRVFVTSQFNSVSLNSHVVRTYRLDHFSLGFVSILAAEQTPENTNWFLGTADAVRQCIRHFEELDVSHILILYGDQLYHMDYRKLISFHLEHRADITVSRIPVTASQAPQFGIMKEDSKNQVLCFQEKPNPDQLATLESDLAGEYDPVQFPQGRGYLASMGIYVFGKRFLIDLLASTTGHDFAQNIFPAAVHKYRMLGYPFSGYWADIGTIRSFFEANLGLTSSMPKFNFYNASNPIYSRSRFLPGSKINNCHLENCIIADGCFLDGVDIRHSIIGTRSRIGTGGTISNSYIIGAGEYETSEDMEQNAQRGIPNVGIASGTSIVNAIIDRNARIGNKVVIANAKGQVNSDGDNYYIRDGIVVIPKGAVIPDGTVI